MNEHTSDLVYCSMHENIDVSTHVAFVIWRMILIESQLFCKSFVDIVQRNFFSCDEVSVIFYTSCTTHVSSQMIVEAWSQSSLSWSKSLRRSIRDLFSFKRMCFTFNFLALNELDKNSILTLKMKWMRMRSEMRIVIEFLMFWSEQTSKNLSEHVLQCLKSEHSIYENVIVK